jgi:phage terminase large subunit
MQQTELIVDYAPRPQFAAFHERRERFACIVTHRRAGKTVACVHDLQRAAIRCRKVRPRFAYLAPFLKQSKAVAWDYLRARVDSLRGLGATTHEGKLRVDYPEGGQVRLYGADNPDALRGIYLDGVAPELDAHARKRLHRILEALQRIGLLRERSPDADPAARRAG